MRRVLVVGLAVATVDGAILGVAVAMGWTLLMVVAVLAGLVGAFVVAMATPPPRAAARPSTVTLGLPLRDTTVAVETDEAAGRVPVGPVVVAEIEPRPTPVTAAA